MKYCTKCGNKLVDEAVICPKCGCMVDNGLQTLKKVETTGRYTTVAKVFLIIGAVLKGTYLIPLLWAIPMTVGYFQKIKDGEKISTGYKVCCLLFVSVIGGIFMLCDND
ncbi:MAG: zinc-ribbon domain-containing protein [Erysipelotrichaceae bacterium]|nr:zinc-ribbon domain-containing protein [Erysipelotrichaceae bacterium]